MNKKLLALAIGAAVAMPVAALADGPTLYGKINVSVESIDDELGLETDVVDLIDPVGPPIVDSNKGVIVRDNASRVGIKGDAETSVEGLKGIYKAEFELNADEGKATLDQRDIWAGLAGNFGTLKLGRMDTPTKVIQAGVDEFNDTSVDMKDHVAAENRADNVIYYATPAMLDDKLVVHVAAVPGEQADVDGDGEADDGVADATSLAVTYNLGGEGLYVGLSLDSDVGNESGGADWVLAKELVADPSLYDPLTTEARIQDASTTRLVVGYSTAEYGLGFLYQKADLTVWINNDGFGNEATGDLSDTSMVLSGHYNVNSWTFKAQYGSTSGDETDVDITMLGLGADYALGKATKAYAFYAQEEADAGAAAIDRSTLAFGLEQKF